MENDLINKNHAVSIIKTAYDDLAQDYAFAAADLLKKYVDEIEAEPAVDAAPVVHGRWIDTGEDDGDGNHRFSCTACGYCDIHSNGVDVPYCWHCGAKMDGKDGTECQT